VADMTLRMILLGIDKSATSALRGVGDEAEKSSSKAAALGKAAGIGLAAIAGGVGVLLKTGYDETKDASAGQAQLEAGLKSTGNAANTTVDSMEALASSIQNYSGQTDDSIVGAEQLLLTFTNIKNNGPDKIFDQATVAAADMAAKLGGDASSQAIVLGKALNDPVKGITALTRVGVSFTDKQKETIAAMVKTGDTAGAQKVILGELNTEFGGAAKAAGQSLPGQLQRAQRSFEDISQAVVTDLLPAVTSLIGFITDYALPAIKAMTQFWMDHKVIVGIIVAAIVGLTAATAAWNVVQGVQAVLAGEAAAATGLQTFALGAQKVALGVATAAQWLFNAAMSANPLVLLALAIVAVIAVIVIIATKTQWFQELWRAAWGAIQNAASAVWNWIKSNWPLILTILTGPIGLAVAAIVKNWGAIKQGFQDVINWTKGAVETYVGFYLSLPGKIADVFSNAGTLLYDAGKDLIQGLINGMKSMLDAAKNVAKNIAGSVVDGAKGLLGIHSPSTVFHEIGTNVVTGFSNGITSNAGLATGSMTALLSDNTTSKAIAAGDAQAVRGGGISTGPAEVHIHFTGAVYGSLQEFAQKITPEISRQAYQGQFQIPATAVR